MTAEIRNPFGPGMAQEIPAPPCLPLGAHAQRAAGAAFAPDPGDSAPPDFAAAPPAPMRLAVMAFGIGALAGLFLACVFEVCRNI